MSDATTYINIQFWIDTKAKRKKVITDSSSRNLRFGDEERVRFE